MIAEEVRKQKAKQYGSFEQNMDLLNRLKNQFSIHSEIITQESSERKKDIMLSTFYFVRMMILLKCIRSLTAENDVLTDCIVGCYNYMQLAKEIIPDIKYSFNLNLIDVGSKIVYFNPRINQENIDLDKLLEDGWLLKEATKDNEAEALCVQFCLKFNAKFERSYYIESLAHKAVYCFRMANGRVEELEIESLKYYTRNKITRS